jgi:glycosyltransferase involved in cell wall biosynthesis
VKQLSTVAIGLRHQVEIAVLERPDEWAGDFKCPVHYVGPAYFKYGYAPGLAAWLRRNASRFGAIIVNGIWQYPSLCTWRVLHSSPLPYYVFTHGMLDPWFKQQYPLKHLKKLLYWPWAEYRVLRDARAVLFTSEEEKLLARRSFKLYRANELVVNYGVPEPTGDPVLQREKFLQHFPQLRGTRILLFLSRIHPKKGCDLLIEAFAGVARANPGLRLVMAGPDQVGMQQRLVEFAERLGVGSAVTWTGMLRGDVKIGAFRAAEAFVLPSHQENFGIAVAEALACGTPVLISNKVNIWREVIADNAGLAADDTLAGTRDLLQNWLHLSPEERQTLASNTRDCFARRFHIEAAAKSVLDTLERYAAKQLRPAA